jgi:glycosyltransferase involved in cell wall biosynthesis
VLGSPGSTAIADLQKKLFRLWLVRAVVGSFFLVRGLCLLAFDQYKGISNLCWVYRVSGVGLLRSIAYRIVTGFISRRSGSESRLVKAFLDSEAPALCKKRFLGEALNLDSMFRDFIVLKPSSEGEKGVLVLEYSQKFDLFIALFDLNRIMKDYYVVLEPCWAGYCDPSILMFVSSLNEVIVQCPEKNDLDFISGLRRNLIPIGLGSSDWIDSELFAPRQEKPLKEYDLVMVANWAKHKNHRQLFKALCQVRHRPLSLLLIGVDWGGRTDKDIVSEMNEYDLSYVKLEIKKNIPAREVADCLEKSKVFLLLSEKEGSNRAIVEALFADVPAILYEKFIGGARGKINEQTGVLSSFQDLHSKIDYMLEGYRRFTPRAWALEHTGSKNATRKLNSLLKTIAESKGEEWTADIVEKVNNPNFSYKVKDSIPRNQQAKAIAEVYYR